MLVDKIIATINTKASGRTRYEGQEPFWDEVLVAEIERLRKAVVTLRDYASVTFDYWDDDKHHKVGKRLNAMAGTLPGYSAAVDAALASVSSTPDAGRAEGESDKQCPRTTTKEIP